MRRRGAGEHEIHWSRITPCRVWCARTGTQGEGSPPTLRQRSRRCMKAGRRSCVCHGTAAATHHGPCEQNGNCELENVDRPGTTAADATRRGLCRGGCGMLRAAAGSGTATGYGVVGFALLAASFPFALVCVVPGSGIGVTDRRSPRARPSMCARRSRRRAPRIPEPVGTAGTMKRVTKRELYTLSMMRKMISLGYSVYT